MISVVHINSASCSHHKFCLVWCMLSPPVVKTYAV